MFTVSTPRISECSEFRKDELTPCFCCFLNSEPLNTEHTKRLLIATYNWKCLTHLVKQSACNQINKNPAVPFGWNFGVSAMNTPGRLWRIRVNFCWKLWFEKKWFAAAPWCFCTWGSEIFSFHIPRFSLSRKKACYTFHRWIHRLAWSTSFGWMRCFPSICSICDTLPDI